MLEFESVWFQRLNLKFDEQLSSFAFSFNLRRYSLNFMFWNAEAFEQDITEWSSLGTDGAIPTGRGTFFMFAGASAWLKGYERAVTGVYDGDGPPNLWTARPP